MPITLNGTTGITSDTGFAADGVSFADNAPANTLVTTSAGNVGVGTSSAIDKLQVNGGITVGSDTVANNRSRIYEANGLNIDAGVSNGRPILFNTGGTERARIDSSGNLLVGTSAVRGKITSSSNSGDIFAAITSNTNTGYLYDSSSTGSSNAMFFIKNNTSAGSINCSPNSTSFNTSSDYRLKEDIAPMVGALLKVAALKPVTYTWKATGQADEGFIAHELQAVCPSAVTGEKDAVDDEGEPCYQGIDTSFLVATLTAAIQELKAIVDQQAQRISALEGASSANTGVPA